MCFVLLCSHRYGGDDKNVGSGRLELRKHDGSESYIDEGFLMENTGGRVFPLLFFLSFCLFVFLFCFLVRARVCVLRCFAARQLAGTA